MKAPIAQPGCPVIVVCGLGRCGTTLTMNMLAAAGIPCVGEAPAYEPAVAYPIGPDWFRQQNGQALKVLDPHRSKLPKFEAYAAIWLTRDHREQAASQAKLATLLNGLPRVGRAHLRRWISGLREEERTARAWLGAHPRLDIQFEDLIDITTGSAGRICRFLKPYFGDVDPVAMERVILPRGPACQPGLDIETALVRAMA